MTALDIKPGSELTLALWPTTDEPTATPIPASPNAAKLAALLSDMIGVDIAGFFEQIEWAEQEIQAAIRRHPQHADKIDRSSLLLRPNPRLEWMNLERIFRAHCREILERVAVGLDTRPGTAAEVCCALGETSLRTPISSEAAGLYMRMWLAAGFPVDDDIAESSRHHEALERSCIDDAEQRSRRKLAVPDRRN